ncbi:MAG: hypothetical protein AAFO06_24520 [Cyanobacteria bacterium J06597_16]
MRRRDQLAQAITSSLNTPANLVLLQQTLESAREALASAQKVMADVDEITGDPQVRNQLRNLINGLGELVSSTQSLEQQSEVARALVPLSEKIGEPLAQPTNAQVESQAVGSVETQSGIPVAVETGAARSIRQHPDASDGKPTLFFDGERYVVRFSQADSKQILKRK